MVVNGRATFTTCKQLDPSLVLGGQPCVLRYALLVAPYE
jgi:hypothetical protein